MSQVLLWGYLKGVLLNMVMMLALSLGCAMNHKVRIQYIEPIFKKRWYPSNITIVRWDWSYCKINLIHAFVTKILQHFFCFHSFWFLHSKNLLSYPKVKGFDTSRQHEVNRRSHIFNSPQDVVKAKSHFNSNS